jgi:hypothetical protein
MQVAHQNVVTSLQLHPPALPDDHGATVGCITTITVEYSTEDGKPLPWEVASGNIAVLLGLPSPDGQEAATAAGGKKGAGGGNSNLVVLAPDREASQAAASSDGASACKVCFTTPELTVAGNYTLTAEYTETRAEMVTALTQQVRMW